MESLARICDSLVLYIVMLCVDIIIHEASSTIKYRIASTLAVGILFGIYLLGLHITNIFKSIIIVCLAMLTNYLLEK